MAKLETSNQSTKQMKIVPEKTMTSSTLDISLVIPHEHRYSPVPLHLHDLYVLVLSFLGRSRATSGWISSWWSILWTSSISASSFPPRCWYLFHNPLEEFNGVISETFLDDERDDLIILFSEVLVYAPLSIFSIRCSGQGFRCRSVPSFRCNHVAETCNLSLIEHFKDNFESQGQD